MDSEEKYLKKLYDLYEHELTNQILPFWLKRCEDKEFGGYFNCFDNTGVHLMSYDKYTWSQGRFVWIFSRLSDSCGVSFTDKQRQEFLRLAKLGRDFLINHVLIGREDYRCVFLMDREGTPKLVDGYSRLDMSIYADCFVILAMAAYSRVTKDRETYDFSRRLYQSVKDRVDSRNFYTLPYPLSRQYRAHGISMILTNVSQEMYDTSEALGDREGKKEYLADIEHFVMDVLNNFAGQDGCIREVIQNNNAPAPGLLGNHINPGHTLEDMWFALDAAATIERPELNEKIYSIVLKTLDTGWDNEYGGIFHYCCLNGDVPGATEKDNIDETTIKQVEEGWGDKLWWVHTEALYTTLRCYIMTASEEFKNWHDKIFSYTFSHFPNPDREIKEWLQILKRDGTPQDKVVALPVKDPYHITRNFLLILEMLKKLNFT